MLEIERGRESEREIERGRERERERERERKRKSPEGYHAYSSTHNQYYLYSTIFSHDVSIHKTCCQANVLIAVLELRIGRGRNRPNQEILVPDWLITN
eukprot:sb/3478926/